MKRICCFLLCAALLCLFGCNKTDDGKVMEVTARFSFVVKDLKLDVDSPGYELKTGDNIDVYATGYDEEEYRKISQMKIPSPKFEYRCNLVYNGLSWDIVKDGAVVKEFEVNGPKNSIIVIQCFFRNPETGAPRVANKEIQLSQGAQIIDLIFN